MQMTCDRKRYSDLVAFHGHSCPGLAIGYRMSLAAMDALGATCYPDEELVAVVENDACGVDALQVITGCTFGKGNLIFRDYGKSVYTLYSRTARRAVRVAFHGREVPVGLSEDRNAYTDFLLNSPHDAILEVKPAPCELPEQARIRRSVPCAVCQEPVMETRLKPYEDRQVCIPCYEGRFSMTKENNF